MLSQMRDSNLLFYPAEQKEGIAIMKKQYGLTMIELLISMALGLFIMAATLTIYVNTIKSSADTLKSARLNHDLGMAMSLMKNDIKRAGFWGGAVIGSTTLLANPFSTATTTVTIGTNVTTDDCILYTYDDDGDGALDVNEYFGFRQFTNTTTNTNTIQIRSTDVACNNTTAAWASITDENMLDITGLQFSFAPQGTATGTSRCYNSGSGVYTDAITCSPAPTAGQNVGQKRMVNIQLSGQLVGADNAEVTKTLIETVKVRNNRVFTQP